ncbi:MAG: TatD family nuclease-associated radical SAM protein, partial [Candidatus Omnitrophota bacterium]
CAGIDLATSRSANAIAEEHRFIYSSVGYHPHQAKDFTDAVLEELRAACRMAKVVAIGEVGLDDYRGLSPMEDQRQCFRRMLGLAREFRHPVILHIRNSVPSGPHAVGQAYADVLNIWNEKGNASLRGVNHCFSGSLLELEGVLEAGLYVSFAGNVTYPKAEDLRRAVDACPLERMLIETDAPFLSPQSHRGIRNEPAYLKDIAEEIAKIKGISWEQVARQTAANTLALFPMSRPGEEQFVYAIGESLYVNVTNACSAHCTFCQLSTPQSELYLKGYRLRLQRDPSVEEALTALNDAAHYREVVFCGYGEPTIRLSFLTEVARALKKRGIRVRLDTNGHGNLIHRRSIVPELAGLIDEVSVSLNAENEETYQTVVQPRFGAGTYEKVKEFILECKKTLPQVVVTFVEAPGINLAACRQIAESLGVEAKFRKLDVVG